MQTDQQTWESILAKIIVFLCMLFSCSSLLVLLWVYGICLCMCEYVTTALFSV